MSEFLTIVVTILTFAIVILASYVGDLWKRVSKLESSKEKP